MSINWAIKQSHKPDSLSPVPLPNEHFLLSISNVSLTLKSSNINISCDQMTAHVSYHRVVLMSKNAVTYNIRGKGDASFDNLIVPMESIKTISLDQPWIGPNGVKFHFLPIAGGGLDDDVYICLIKFMSGGAFEFYEKLSEAKQGEALPEYQE